MESASSRFFSIPELVNHLALFLNHRGVSRMMQTSRKLNENCTPALYYDIQINYRFTKRGNFTTRDSTKAFARNTHHVRQFTLNIPEVTYYANCNTAYEDQLLYLATTDTTSNDHSPQQLFSQGRRPLWVAPLDPHNYTVLPIPPMTQLTKLLITAEYSVLNKDLSYLIPEAKDPKATLTFLCWIMDLNPHLQDVSFSRVIIKDQRDLRLLTTSIFGLKNLQKLRLPLYHMSEWEMPADLPSVVFFCCPASLQSLYCSLENDTSYWEQPAFEDYLFTTQGQLQAWEKGEMECGIPVSIPRRQEPLLRLKSLSISDFRDYANMPEDDFVSVLAHCPNLTDISLPMMAGVRNLDYFAIEIARLCPNLSRIRPVNIAGTVAQRLAMRLLKTLPEQQAKDFTSQSFDRIMDINLGDVRQNFQRHSTTLQAIEITGFHNVDSKTIQVILTQCESLERLYASWTFGDTERQLCIELADAIEYPWRCTKIRELKIMVAIPDEPLHCIAAGRGPYYSRPAPIALSTTEKDQFKSLETFYRQVGLLTELRILNLRAIFYDPQGHRPLSNGTSNMFPGMMSLGCEDTGRPGFLHHFAGLSKLKRLFGSVSADSEENRATIGRREAEWMMEHWPVLVGYSPNKTRYI